MESTAAALFILLAVSLPGDHGCAYASRGRPAAKVHLDSSEEGRVVQPLRFDQRLIVCNAYPSTSPISVRKNDQEALAEGNSSMPFGQCHYMSSRIKKHDRLNVVVKGIEIHGTFEVGALPASDVVLLLVLEKRSVTSPLVSFRSFAIPARSGRRDAQLAVIDAFRGNASKLAHLRMEDHVNGKEEKTVSKRVEQLNFDRVYSIEEGAYDASIAGHSGKKLMKLARSQNYVILRTGEEGHFPESLAVYPAQGLESKSQPVACTWALVLALAGSVVLSS